jgi:hypothetical protein
LFARDALETRVDKAAWLDVVRSKAGIRVRSPQPV